MSYRKHYSRSALLASTTILLVTSIAGTAIAQDAAVEEETTIETIQVTGSIIKRSETSTALPITVLTNEQLDLRGINTISDAVQMLAANNAGSMSNNWNSFGFASGATAVSLRGLTTGATLTIFDGMRSAVYPLGDDGRRNFVDLGTIPNAIVERIEVLKDGGSSTYGADAVAGVVNVITKKEITGVHLNSSIGISQKGDAEEYRFDATAGYGELNDQGFNMYVNVEYQKNNPLFASDRGFPYNTSDLSSVCNSSGGCLDNNVQNGIQSDGSFLGIGNTNVPVARPYDPITGLAVGDYQLLNPAAGCGDLTPVTLTAAQMADGDAAAQQCQQDIAHDFYQSIPETSRYGANARFTMKIGDNAEAYAMVNYYEVHTMAQTSPLNFAGRTAAGGTQVTISPFFLPVYVCPNGTVTCDGTNGTLNPNNPFAGDGNLARVNYRYDRGRSTSTFAQTVRAAAGIVGTMGDDWDYTFDVTTSSIRLDVTRHNYLFAQHLLDVAADGSFNFLDTSTISDTMRDYIAPDKSTLSTSSVTQVQGTLAKPVYQMAGGDMVAAVGVSYREEAVDNPSANPANEFNPYDRYYSLNSVATAGSRNVKSAFFEIDAPVHDMLNLNVSGRYDDYSSGQSNFSPKFAATFAPVDAVKLRGTFSKGFRIPSFNESYGLPTTGYVTATVTPTSPGGAAYIAAHGGNAYSTLAYNYGLTSSGNEELKSEKSTSYTVGLVLEPTDNISFTVDYYHIKIKDLVSGVDYSPVAGLYYANNGVVNLPGITVLPGIADPENPNALPQLGFIQYSYRNADSQVVSGIDFTANFMYDFDNGMHFNSHLDASYLIKNDKTIDGDTQSYAGTLSPCDVTSCSGSPQWRGTWTNSIETGKLTVALTANYTSGYDNASVDYGGIKGDCDANIGASVVPYNDNTPFNCKAKAYLDFDMSVSYQVNDTIKLYGNIMDVFGKKAPFDPSAAYGLYNYNPAWASSGFRGRYFRFGVKADF